MQTRGATKRKFDTISAHTGSSPPTEPVQKQAIKAASASIKGTESGSISRSSRANATPRNVNLKVSKRMSAPRQRKKAALELIVKDEDLPHGLGPASDWLGNDKIKSDPGALEGVSDGITLPLTPDSATEAIKEEDFPKSPVVTSTEPGQRLEYLKDDVANLDAHRAKPDAKSLLVADGREKDAIPHESYGDKPDDYSAKVPSSGKKNAYGLTPGTTPFPDWIMPTPEACEEVNRLLTGLHGEYKPPAIIPPPSLTVTGCGEVPDLLEALMRTLLSASTTANNANMAFAGLVKEFGHGTGTSHTKSLNWEAVRKADLATVVNSIKRGGLANAKGKNIKGILDAVYAENVRRKNALLDEQSTGVQAKIPGAEHESKEGKRLEMSRTTGNDLLSLDHFSELTTEDAMTEMTKLPGIGVKTASCVILFCMKRPSFAVDTHVWRHCKWLGWVPPGADRNKTFSHCEVRIPDHLKYSLHQLFLQHGKKCPRCRANTSAGTKEWDEAECPIDHLLTRNEGRKQLGAKPSKKSGSTQPTKNKRSRAKTAKIPDDTSDTDGGYDEAPSPTDNDAED